MERPSEQIKLDVIDQLEWDSRIHANTISVEVVDGTVRLSGTVDSYMERQAAEMDSWTMPGVKSVDNRLSVARVTGARLPKDDEVQWNVKSVLTLNSAIDSSNIEVVVNDGVVLLNGSVDAFWKKARAEELAFEVQGVFMVVNNLTVVPSGSPLDQSIAADILGAFSRIGGIDLDAVNVEVEGGRVALKGRVPNWQTYAAAHSVAKYTRGVVDLTNNLVISR